MVKRILWALPALVCLGIAQLHAQDKRPVKPDTLTDYKLDNVTIYGASRTDHNVTEVGKKQLTFIQGVNLGATLSHIPGVQSTYMGPGAGTPIIRSYSGNRVKILVDGLPANDLSGISPTLNADIDQDGANSMEVFKASASVLYGGKAIGGAVNLNTNIIPSHVPDKSISGYALTEGGRNYGNKQAVGLTGGNKRNIAWHLGGSNQHVSRIYIPGNTKPGFVYDPKLVGFNPALATAAQIDVESEHVLNTTIFPYISQFVLNHLGDDDWGLSEDDKWTFKDTWFDSSTFTNKPNPKNPAYVAGQDPVKDRYTDVVKSVTDFVTPVKGEIPNSGSTNQGINAGVNYIKERYSLGLGYNGTLNNYGVPAYAIINYPKGHSHDANQKPWVPEYGAIGVKSHSNTINFKAEFRPLGIFRKLMLTYALNKAVNNEMLNQYMATNFNVSQHALHAEARQIATKYWTGVSGVDFDFRQMKGEGSMRYLPNNLSRELGFYTLQTLALPYSTINVGYRRDEVTRAAISDATFVKTRGLAGGKLSERKYGLNQFTTNLTVTPLKGLGITGSFAHSERAPDVNELYAGNRHFAIVTEENGDDRLRKEFANTIEGGFSLGLKNLSVKATIYQTEYRNYIYLAHTGISRDRFIVKEWRQANNRVNGTEAELTYRVVASRQWQADIGGYYDLVKSINVDSNEIRRWADGDYLPNLPSSRFGFNANVNYSKLGLTVAFDRYLQQKYLARDINVLKAMPAYNLLNARLTYSTRLLNQDMQFYAYGANLLNADARPQSSMFKYLAPLPGIAFGLGIKLTL